MKKGWIYALFISGGLLLFSCGNDRAYEDEGIYETTAGDEGIYETTAGEEQLNQEDEFLETTAGTNGEMQGDTMNMETTSGTSTDTMNQTTSGTSADTMNQTTSGTSADTMDRTTSGNY